MNDTSMISVSSVLIAISALLTLAALYISYIWLPSMMRKSYRQSLLTLSRIVEEKDALLQGRGERIADYALMIMKKLHISAKQSSMIEYAAYLHEIGVVSANRHDPNDPNEQIESEKMLSIQHALTGADIVSNVNFLKDIAPIIKHHHEFWDGTGLPDGLRGVDIPLGARILSVCSTYDSIIYPVDDADKISKNEAFDIIKAGSGIKFDPHIVNVFIEAMKD